MWINVGVWLTRHVEGGMVQVLQDVTEASALKDHYLTSDALPESCPRASGRPADCVRSNWVAATPTWWSTTAGMAGCFVDGCTMTDSIRWRPESRATEVLEQNEQWSRHRVLGRR